MEEEKMKSIILYNQGGYSPELLAFNGETNFAILYYACTIKPYVLARKLDDDVRSDEFEEVACFEKYDDCLQKYQSLVLQHLEKTIPVTELFKHLKKTDLDNVVGLAGEKIMDDEDDERRWEKIWSALIRYRHPIIKECIEKIQVLYDVKISGWDK